MKTIRLIVKGKVQGVFYRATAKEAADKLGVTGWTKNLSDKNVEIIATSSAEILQQFITWCWQGPSRARVDEIIIDELPFEHFIGFRIIK